MEVPLFLSVSKQRQEMKKGKTPQSLQATDSAPDQHRKEVTVGTPVQLFRPGSPSSDVMQMACTATRSG